MNDTRTKILLASSKDPSREYWLDLPFDEDDFEGALESIGVSDPNSNGVFDFDKIIAGEEPEGYFVKEWQSDYLTEKHFTNIFEASDLVEKIEDFDKWTFEKFEALYEFMGDLEEAVERAEDDDIKFYSSTNLEELAREFADEGVLSKEFLLNHIDWESVGRELGYDGYVEVNGGVLRTD